MGVYASQRLCQLARQPVEVQHATPRSFVWKLRGIVIKLSTKSASVNTRRTTSGDYPEQVLFQSQRDSSCRLIHAMNRAFENVLCHYEINRLWLSAVNRGKNCRRQLNTIGIFSRSHAPWMRLQVVANQHMSDDYRHSRLEDRNCIAWPVPRRLREGAAIN
jgi:hypothetical protein